MRTSDIEAGRLIVNVPVTTVVVYGLITLLGTAIGAEIAVSAAVAGACTTLWLLGEVQSTDWSQVTGEADQ